MRLNSVLVVDHLTKIFTQRSGFLGMRKTSFTAVDNLSFTLERGEIVGILGANGAGKTTTIQMLLSTLKPTSGSISYFGKNFFTHRSETLQHIAFASTYIKLPNTLTVEQNLDVYGRLYGLSRRQRLDATKKFLTHFGMWDLRSRLLSELSAGQITRVMLAKAFLANPRLVLLDEPTASLDPDIALEVRQFILEQRRNHNVSFLLTSHNMDEVTETCDRVLVLHKGKLIASDTPAQLAARVRQATVEFIIVAGIEHALAYLNKHNYHYTQQDAIIKVHVDSQAIAKFLQEITHIGIEYSQIAIEKPTLEDYFLTVLHKSRV